MKLLALFLVAALAGVLFTAEAQRRTEVAQRLPLIYWGGGVETAEKLKQAGIDRIAAPASSAAEWRKAGLKVVPMSQAELERREKLLTPRVAGRANVASPTQRPWIDANGWRFVRNPSGRFYYELPQGRAAIAAAEAFAYHADAVLKIDPADLEMAAKMLAFLRELPPGNLPVIADIGVIDDGSPTTGEVMNLLTRRNLLFKKAPATSSRFRVNIRLGSKEYPEAEASDPSAFAQKVRRRLGDENRSLRVYGSEIVICRLTGNGSRAKLHLLNYGGREIDSLRVRLRGKYGQGVVKAFGHAGAALEEFVVADGATEFSISKMGVYCVIDLPAMR
ncbi:MAG: hypothetical protein ACREBD_22325 [Blastocatellia bacterium]